MEQALRVVFMNERGLRAGWRLTIFLAMILVLAVGAQSISRLAGGGSPGAAGPLPAGFGLPLILAFGELLPFLILLFLCWIMSRIEHRTVGEYGLPLRRPAWAQFWSGYFLWGFVPLSVLLLVMRAAHLFYFGGLALHGSSLLIWGLLWAITFLMVGFLEEFLFRGYVLHTLAEGIGFWPAALILALVFARAHMGNTGETRVGVIATAFFALFAAVTLRKTGNLWLAVGAHAGWDWSQSFLYGVPDSGFKSPGHMLDPQLSTSAPAWLSGGTVGPEGSIFTLVLWAGMLLIFYLIYRKPRQPALVVELGGAPPQQAS